MENDPELIRFWVGDSVYTPPYKYNGDSIRGKVVSVFAVDQDNHPRYVVETSIGSLFIFHGDDLEIVD